MACKIVYKQGRCHRLSVIVAQNDFSLRTSVFCSQKHVALDQYPFQNTDISTSQSVIKQSYIEKTTARITMTKLGSLHSAAIQFS